MRRLLALILALDILYRAMPASVIGSRAYVRRALGVNTH